MHLKMSFIHHPSHTELSRSMRGIEGQNLMGYKTSSLLWISLFTAMTAAGGMIRIPTLIVPITLQTLFVYLAGDLLGGKRGAYSQLLFLILGLIGIPIFAMGGGPGYILQPTFGYLASFPLAAWVIGITAKRFNNSKNWLGWISANSAGFVVVNTIGVVYLYININLIAHKQLSWQQAFWSGIIVFVPGEIVKIILAAALARRLKPLMDSIQHRV